MLPIPTHLENILIPVGTKNDGFHVKGTIRCPCGCDRFHISHYADVSNGFLQSRECDGGYALIIKAICTGCGSDHLIFDDSRHGWNGFVCHSDVKTPKADFGCWKCLKCGGDTHGIVVDINSQGMQDFIDEAGLAKGKAEFREGDWVNAFDWITVGLKCCGCGYDIKKWVDYETM